MWVFYISVNSESLRFWLSNLARNVLKQCENCSTMSLAQVFVMEVIRNSLFGRGVPAAWSRTAQKAGSGLEDIHKRLAPNQHLGFASGFGLRRSESRPEERDREPQSWNAFSSPGNPKHPLAVLLQNLLIRDSEFHPRVTSYCFQGIWLVKPQWH